MLHQVGVSFDLCGWLFNATSRPLYPRETDAAVTVQEAGWALGPVWTGAENLAPTGIRTPDRPARSQSLYRLSYPIQGQIQAAGLF